jgi:hypothetical protein
MVTSSVRPGEEREREIDSAGKAQGLYDEVTYLSSCQRGRSGRRESQMSDSNKNLVMDPRWVTDTKTAWATDRRLQHNFDYILSAYD